MYVILYTCVLCMFEIHLCVCVHMMAMWYRMYYGGIYIHIHVHTLGTTGMQTIPNKYEGNLCYFQCVVKPYLFLHDLLLMHTYIDVHIKTIYVYVCMYVCMYVSVP